MGSQDIRALGAADGASVRGRGLDCSATHGDARHHVYGGLSMRLVAGSVIFGWLFLGASFAPAGAAGGTMRFSGKKGGFLITRFTARAPIRAGPRDKNGGAECGLACETIP